MAKGTFSQSANDVLRVEVSSSQLQSSVTRAPDCLSALACGSMRTGSKRCRDPIRGRGTTRVVDGLLEMNPKVFTLLQSDINGAGLKVMNFAGRWGF